MAEKKPAKEDRTFYFELPEGFTFLNSDSTSIKLKPGDSEYFVEFQGNYLPSQIQ